MLRTLSLRLAAVATIVASVVAPSALNAQKALVYCPVGIDAGGCTTIVAALNADATRFPDGADAGYDGTQGTLDLATADFSGYAVFVVPSLADGPDAQPYALLRNGTIAARLKAAFVGRVAVWSGTPDVGSTNRSTKDGLIRNLVEWAGADAAGTHGPGLVVLQDNSDDVAARYGWLAGISSVSVAADSTLDVYSNVQVVTNVGRTILTNSSGLQIGYSNMASFGLKYLGGIAVDATGGTSGRRVLATAAGEPSDPSIATVRTDKEDYQPGETVIITGAGWEPGETVSMRLHEDPVVHGDRTLSAVADESGNIFNNSFSPEEHDFGVRFVLEAAGLSSGRTAQATFTDGKVLTATIGTFSVTGSPGSCTNTSQTSFAQTLQVCAKVSITSIQGNTTNQTTEFFVVWFDRTGTLRRTSPQFSIPTNPTLPFAASDILPPPTGGNQGPNPWQARVCSNANCTGAGNTHATTDFTFLNVAPVATDDAATTNEDNAVSINVRANDTDANGDTLTVSIVTAPPAAAGTAVVAANQTITFTPAANFNGSTSFTYRANDGVANSNNATVSVTVNAVNDAPSFTKGADQTVLEDAGAQSVANWATNISAGPSNESGQTVSFEITNNTNTALFSTQPAVSPTGTLTYAPAANAFGTATITLRIKDNGGTANGGVDVSATQTFVINVTGVNDAPSFTKGPDQSVADNAGPQSVANWATAISAGPNESGQTLTFEITNNTNTGLFSAGPAVSSTGTLTYTPSGTSGTATITLRLKDNGGTANGGVDTSPTQTFVITVTATNAAPVAVDDGPYSVDEDNTLTVLAAQGVLANDTDANSDPLTAVLVTGPAAASTTSFTLNADGSFTFKPAADFFGSVSFTYRANDGTVNSANVATVSITVNPVNDAPSFTKGADETVLEDAGAQTVPNWATNISAGPSNESAQTVSFEITNNSNTALFSTQPAVSPSGTLTYTPADDAFGSATITLRIKDNGGTANGGIDASSTQTFQINVTGVNDAPSFTKGDDQTVNEDAGAQSVTNWATAISAGPNESGQTVSFEITNNTNTALFSSQPAVSASGTLTYTPADDAFGEATITLRIKDDGGTANGGVDQSPTQSFKITVNPVNDAPTFDIQGNQTVLEDAGAQTVPAFASNMSVGPANESAQSLTGFTVTNDDNTLFSVQPAVNLATGNLTYTPDANAFGTTTVTVRLSDNGGTANGGVNFSEKTFTITIKPVNDAPSFTKGNNQTVNEDAGAQTVANWATAISAGPANESGQIVSFLVSNNNNALFSTQPAVSNGGTLTYTPAANANGSATVTVTAKDNGGTADGGVDTSSPQTFTITVNAVNDAPTFTAGSNITSAESGSLYTATGWATSMSAGPADEAGQTLHFEITTDASRFITQPAINASTGTLTFRAKSTPNTPISLSVVLKDDGGTAYGGVDTSVPATFTITITNVAPSGLAATLPVAPVQINTQAPVNVTFTDPGPEDVHTVTINWGDATAPTVQTLTVGARMTQPSHAYAQPNVYVVTVTVADGDGGSISDTYEYIVVYDPDGGFVTGGGTIYSPPGAYKPALTVEGRANFGFVSKYVKNSATPTGSTEFQFQAGNVNFKSTNYEWLVVSGTKGQYRGYGTINGAGNYRFVLTVDDGTPDKFRLRIWSDLQSDDGNGSIVYDNQLADPNDAFANAKAAIETGSIVVHAPNGKVASK
jgi:hypothetical protein